MANVTIRLVMVIGISRKQPSVASTIHEAERSTTLLRFVKLSKNPLRLGEIDIWISKRKIFDLRLRLAKILSERFGRRSIIGLANGSFDCVYGRRRTTGLPCGGSRNHRAI